MRRDAVQHRRDRTTGRQRTHNAEHETPPCHPQRLTHDELEDLAPARSERDPGPHLLSTLRHDVAQDAVQADCREQQAQPPEEAQKRRAHAPRAQLRRRSEEHTSELQSPCNLVCRLLLEKKKRSWHVLVVYCRSRRGGPVRRRLYLLHLQGPATRYPGDRIYRRRPRYVHAWWTSTSHASS